MEVNTVEFGIEEIRTAKIRLKFLIPASLVPCFDAFLAKPLDMLGIRHEITSFAFPYK